MNLRSLVHQVLTETSLSDPREVAVEVASRLRGPSLRAALLEALAVYVRVTFGRDRMLSQDSPAGASSKVAAVASDWARQVLTPVAVDGVWKRLGECTADDLRAIAASLRSMADQTLSKAEWYEDLASALPAGAVVADLDADPLAVAA